MRINHPFFIQVFFTDKVVRFSFFRRNEIDGSVSSNKVVFKFWEAKSIDTKPCTTKKKKKKKKVGRAILLSKEIFKCQMRYIKEGTMNVRPNLFIGLNENTI